MTDNRELNVMLGYLLNTLIGMIFVNVIVGLIATSIMFVYPEVWYFALPFPLLSLTSLYVSQKVFKYIDERAMMHEV